MAVIDVTMDTAGVERGSFILSDQLDKVSNRIKELTSVQNTFNAAGVQTGATIKGITEDGKEFAATLGVMTKAERELAAAGQDVALGLKNIKYKDAKKDTDDLGQSTSKLRELADKLATSFRYFVTFKAFNFIADGLRDGVKEANKLQIEISKIRTISQGKDQQTGKKFGEDIRGVSDRTGIDVNEVAKAFYDTTSNQVARGAQTQKFVETAAQLARVTGSNTTDTVNLLSSRINAFGLSAKDADKLAAQFFRTIDEGRVVASEMASTLGRVDVLADNLGIAMEDVNAVIAITTQKGFKTSDALTLLTNLMIKLEKPTEATGEYFKSIGANSGEAAVKIKGGLLPLMDDLVKKVEQGDAAASSFFDEIRGRKQFGILQQSLPDIGKFAASLKDTRTTMDQYQEAIKIRGESPADQLNQEINKLSNIFKVDLGQEILGLTNQFVKLTGGVDNAKLSVQGFGKVAQVVGFSLAGVVVVTTAVAAKNFLAAQSYTALGTAASSAFKVMLPLLAAYAGYQVGKAIFHKDFDFFNADPTKLRATADAVAEMNKELEKLKKNQGGSKQSDPDQFFTDQTKKVSDGYREVQTIIGQVMVANATALEDAKRRSKEVAESIKISFGTWSDTLKTRIGEFRKVVIEANNEIDKSKKNVLGFKDTLDEILFQTKLKYANDDDRFGNQKQNLVGEQIGSLRKRGEEAFKLNTPEGAAEGRKLFADAAKLQAELKDLQVETDKKRLEKFGGPGEKLLLVDTNDLLKAQLGLKQQLDKLEEEYQKKQGKRAKDYEQGAKLENERLERLNKAFDVYSKLDLTTKDGNIDPAFRDKDKKFDRSKLDAALGSAEKTIRENAGGTIDERLKLEKEFAERRRSLYKEAKLLQDQDELKADQAKFLTQEERAKAAIEKVKTDRDKLLADQNKDFEIFNQFPVTLAAMVDKLGKSGRLDKNSDDMKAIVASLQEYSRLARELEANKVDLGGGRLAYDPARLERATKAGQAAIDQILTVKDKLGDGRTYLDALRGKEGTPVDLSLTDDQGQTFKPGEARQALREAERRLLENRLKLQGNKGEEGKLQQDYDKTLREPLEKIKTLFPDLKTAASDFTTSTNSQFKGLADGGVNDLIEKLKRVQELLPKAGAAGKIGALLGGGGDALAGGDFGGEVYAATGGIAGLFPGQPRGLDVYPIWAAKGEMIINARSAAMYKPMLEAIQNRRQPQYMAAGGRVGGDTHVGDINVNVNGGATGSDTARVIGNRLERDLRRGVIKLNGKR